MKHVPIIMPQLGQSVAEGTILKWTKRIGDELAADEILLEVETDKTTVEIESPAPGRLSSCLKKVGEIAAPGEVIGMLETEDDVAVPSEAAPPRSKGKADTPHAGQTQTPVTVSAPRIRPHFNNTALPDINRDRFSPYVLRLAMLNNLTMEELDAIRGSGRGGRVTKNDILQHLARRPIGPTTVEALTGKSTVSEEDLASLGHIIPMTSVRRTIADHMIQSIHTSAHVTMVHAVDMTHIAQLRARVKDAFSKTYQARLSYTAVMIWITSRVLRDFPMINATVYGTNIIQRNEINIGCAVALSDESLVVPVVRRADQKSFPEVARELSRLIRLARDKALVRGDVESGTFTVSNFGSFGSLIGTPLINQPQVAILGMGAVFKSPVVVKDEVCIRDQLYLSFSFDHRVIDGALGGRFLNAIQTTTEALREKDLNLAAL